MSSLGENIKNLRKVWGLTQKELAEKIYVAENTVTSYERGSRIPDMEKIQQIASLFKMTEDDLVNGDFSDLDYHLSPITHDSVISHLEKILPIIHTDSAMNDPYFVEGYRRTVRFWDSIKTVNGPILESMIAEAYNRYGLSLKKYNTVESAANILWLLFVKYMLISDEQLQKTGEAIINGKGKEKTFAKEYLIAESPSKPLEAKRKLYSKKYNETITKMIKRLKTSAQYSDLGDYYLALRYIYGLIDDDTNYNEIHAIGIAMLSAFLELDNEYAFSFFDFSFSLCGPREL